MFGVGVLVTSLLTLITPQMAYLNLWALVACRVIIGIFEVSIIKLYVKSDGKYVGNDLSSNACLVWKVGTTIGEKHDGNSCSCRYIVHAINK